MWRAASKLRIVGAGLDGIEEMIRGWVKKI
jgi:hypothetical protein